MRNNIKEERLIAKLNSELGAVILAYLSDPSIIELAVNSDGKLWANYQTTGFYDTGEVIEKSAAHQLICTIAHHQGLTVNEQNPILETELPFSDFRFSGVLPPIVPAASFVIRKPCASLYTLDDYISQSILTANQAAILRSAIRANESFVVAGGPGTGKTTFANALLYEMISLCNPNERYILIEDTLELKCSASNKLGLKTNKHITHDCLLIVALRLSPDRIVIGECRGAEMFTLLKAWNTGTKGGITTIHANSADSALVRIKDLANESGLYVSPHLISESVDVVVILNFDDKHGRKVSEILKVNGYKDGEYDIKKY